jgi:hypothetical protein
MPWATHCPDSSNANASRGFAWRPSALASGTIPSPSRRPERSPAFFAEVAYRRLPDRRTARTIQTDGCEHAAA